jgi:hypothetical protein
MYTSEQIDEFASHGWVTTRDSSFEQRHPRLDKKDRALYEQAKRDRYLTGGDCELRGLWFLYSEARGWPYLVLRPGGKYAAITVDFIATPDRKLEGIFEKVWRVVLSHADTLLKKNTRLSGADIRFTLDKIPSGIAAPIANEIADLCFTC